MFLIDGLGVGDVGNIVLRDRKMLSQDGILVVVVTLGKDEKENYLWPRNHFTWFRICS